MDPEVPAQPQYQPEQSNSKKGVILIIIGILFIAVTGGVTYYMLNQNAAEPPDSKNQSTQNQTQSVSTPEPKPFEAYITYNNNTFTPDTIELTRNKEGIVNLTFENVSDTTLNISSQKVPPGATTVNITNVIAGGVVFTSLNIPGEFILASDDGQTIRLNVK